MLINHVNLHVGEGLFSENVHQRTFLSVFHHFFNSGKLLMSRDFSHFSFSFEVGFELFFEMGKYVS